MYSHVDVELIGVVMSTIQFNVKGWICIIRVFPVKDVHLHLIVVTCQKEGQKMGWSQEG